MQEDGRTLARAVVRVAPARAACYWKAVSEALERVCSQAANLEVSVLEPSSEAAEGAPHFVELEMRCEDLDQSILDDAVRYAVTTCDAQTYAAPADANPRLADQETRWEPLGVQPVTQSTVKAPLLPRLAETIHAPLLFGRTPVVAPEAPADEESPPSEAIEPLQPASRADEPLQPAAVPLAAQVPEAAQPADVAPPSRPRSSLGAHARELVNAVIAVVVIVVGLRLMVQTFSVDGPSMQPTFETDERLLINRVAYWHVDGTPFEGLVPATRQGSVAYVFGGPRRGDVVVFRPPGDSGFQSDLIKRVIGLPGDTVSIQTGQVYVNGQLLNEPYVKIPADYTYPDQGLAVLIPNDSYFVLGDNRPVSVDSHFGWVVPADKLVGQAWVAYWPINQWHIIPGVETSIAG